MCVCITLQHLDFKIINNCDEVTFCAVIDPETRVERNILLAERQPVILLVLDISDLKYTADSFTLTSRAYR